jgi:tetratricopeptide (TPR) repeat protein
MAKHHVLIAAAFAIAPYPAIAGVTVLGSSSARMCYLAAESAAVPGLQELRRCDAALSEEAADPRHVIATYVNRGILRLRRGNVDGAIADFDQALRRDPNEPEAYLNRGSALLRSDRRSEAVAMFSQAIEHDTRQPAMAHYGRAMAYELLGNARAAYYDYRRASELDPDWAAPREDLQRFRVVPASATQAG